MYGGLWPWVCVAMCVAGLSLDKGEGILTSQQIVAARPQAGRVRRERRQVGPSEEDRGKSRVRVLPGFSSFLDRYILTVM